MKIVQINAVYNISSTGRTTTELHNALLQKGHESYVLCSKTNKYGDMNVECISTEVDIKLHGLMSRLSGKQGYFSSCATRKIIKRLNEIKPDVVHLRNLHGNYINVPMILKYLAENNIATVVTLHDCWFFTGKCCYYTDDNCDKWQYGCGNCPALKKWNKSWLFDKSAEMLADKKHLFSNIEKLGVIGVSDWITNEAKQSILKDTKIVKRIYNWIDLQQFSPKDTMALRKDLNIENDFVVLGVSQYWSVEKGILKIIDVAKRMPECKFVLVGKMIESYDLPENVICIGLLSNADELAKYYSMADVLINPSVQETFGKTTAEAIASGTPVIGYNVTATPELIGVDCGIVLELDCETDEIVNAVKTIRSNGKKHYFENCINFAQNNFNKNNLIDEYIEVYKQLIDVE